VSKPRCETCRFLCRDVLGDDRDAGAAGECRRYPPVRVEGFGLPVRPGVGPLEWCGEYQPAIQQRPAGGEAA
jgi:hypothetical protein